MDASHSAPGRPVYEICFNGHLDERHRRWFEGMELTRYPAGHTIVTGALADQAALYGVLSLIRDLGLELVSVRRLDP